MKKTITYAFTAVGMLFCSTIYAQAVSFSSNTYFISFNSNTSSQIIDNIKQDLNSSEIWADNSTGLKLWRVDHFPYVTSEGDTITNINENVVVTEEKTEVDQVGFNYSTHVMPIDENTPSCNQQSFPVYIPQGSNPIKISILDTGISDISDNSQNGFNYSLNGYSGYDYINNDQVPEDDNGHGSHISGIIADLINYSPDLNITLDIRKTHDAGGHGYISDIVRAITDAVNENTDVINMSFSYKINSNSFNPLQVAIDYAEDNGVLMVASAGNNSENNDIITQASYPASFFNENIISVTSNDCDRELSWFSNYGESSVDVSVLGEKIPGPDLGSGIVYKSGTSQSTAIVSAVSAILGTHQRIFSASQIKCLLINTSDFNQALESLLVSNGTINANTALENIEGLCFDPDYNLPVTYRSSDAYADVMAYPNPFYDHLQVDVSSGTGTYTIYGSNGQLMKEGTLKEGYNTINNMEELMPGYYILTLSYENKEERIPIIKM